MICNDDILCSNDMISNDDRIYGNDMICVMIWYFMMIYGMWLRYDMQ